MTPAELPKFIDLIRQLQQAFNEETNLGEKQGILNNFSYYLQSKMGDKLPEFYQEAYPQFPIGGFTLMMVDEQLPQLLEGFYKRLWKSQQETQ